MKWIKRLLLVIFSFFVLAISLPLSYCAYRAAFNPWSTMVTLPDYSDPQALFLSSDAVLVFGSRQTVQESLVKRWQPTEAFVRRRKDKDSSWSEVFRGTGEICSVGLDHRSANIVALRRDISQDGHRDSRNVLVSNDKGVTWRELPVPYPDIVGLDFSCDGDRFMWTPSKVLSVTDEMSVMSEAKTPASGLRYWSSSRSDHECTLWYSDRHDLVSYQPKVGWRKEDVGSNMLIDAARFNPVDSMMWLVVREEVLKKTLVLRRTGDNAFAQIASFPFFLADDILMEGSVVAIPGVNTDDVVSFLGLEHVLYISKDGGKSWDRDTFVPPFAKEPYSLNQGVLCANASLGRIDCRKL